jgi:hypothetical protein
MTGGRDRFLSDLDLLVFKTRALEHCRDVECLTTRNAVALATATKRECLRRAVEIMRICGLTLYHHLEGESQSCRSWVNETAEICSLRIAPPQYLEAARRWLCNSEAISQFYVVFGTLFQRNPRLIFNADETMVSGMKRFRVLAKMGKLPLVTAEAKLLHLTAMCTISASGTVLKPLIVLPSLKGLKRLAEFLSDAYFATNLTGWMNRDLFIAWSICFSAQLSAYRLTLSADIRDEPILLVLDSHISRVNIVALTILDSFNVDILCLPTHSTHSTHIMQSIDVVVVATLKCQFKEELSRRLGALAEADPGKREKSDILRQGMCGAFLDALRKASTRSNCAAGFRHSGMVPLSSQFMTGAAAPRPDPTCRAETTRIPCSSPGRRVSPRSGGSNTGGRSRRKSELPRTWGSSVGT